MANELYHHGILGQKWGVRRSPEQLGHKPESSTWKSKDAGNLDDAELNRRINRLNKEKQYKDLTASSWEKAGKTIVQGILIGTTVVVAKNALQRGGDTLVRNGAALVKNAFDNRQTYAAISKEFAKNIAGY